MKIPAQDARYELGKMLRERRLERSLTQRNVALQAHVDYTYVSKIEGGVQPPSLETLSKISSVLGLRSVEVNELLVLMGRLPEDLPVNQRRLLAMYYPERG